MNYLKDELEEKNDQLHKAGQLGKDLMGQIEELEQTLQTVSSNLHEKEAEIFDNERRLHLKDEEVTALKHESELMQQSLEEKIKLRLSQKERQLEKQHHSHSEELSENIAQLQAELARSEERGCKVREVNVKLSDEIIQLKEELLTSTGAVADITQQDKDLSVLGSTVEHLTKEISGLESKVRHYEDQLKALNNKNKSLAESVERLECENTTHFNLTQEQRTLIIDLQMELDLQKAVEPQQATNGNSLFAEVDDRRRRLEKENRIYKGKYRSLDESYKHLLVSRDRIKNELLAVYARSEALTVDSNRLMELEKTVCTQNKEVKLLTSQLHDSKKKQCEIESVLEDLEYSYDDTKPAHRIDSHKLERDNKKLVKDLNEAKLYQKRYKLEELIERDRRIIIEKDLYTERKKFTTEYQKGVTLQIRADELESLYQSNLTLCKTLEEELERSTAAQAKGLNPDDFQFANFSINESFGDDSTQQIIRQIDGPGGRSNQREDERTTVMFATPPIKRIHQQIDEPTTKIFKTPLRGDEPTTKIFKTPLRASENRITKPSRIISKTSPIEEPTTQILGKHKATENIKPPQKIITAKGDVPSDCAQQ